MSSSQFSMSQKDYYAAKGNASAGCGCASKPVACTLAAPQPYVPACVPAAFHRGPCQSSAYFTLSNAY